MADFGAICVLIALVLATYAGAASLLGARRGSARLLESGRAAVYALTAVLGLASVAMVQAFVSGDYSIKYVQHYSDAQAPLAYKISAYWGGLDGSMLFWAALLAVFAAIAVYSNRHRQREILPYAIAVMAAVADFFLYLIIFEKNPFDTFLVEIPASGQGLNPLLQNPYMVTHPPALYGGFVGLTVPYAFAMAALISGQLDDAWLAAIRRWALASWFLLTLGLVLGMIWAYEVLGWGGFWAWDPVENAGLLPWLTATAMLHSMKVQERRGLLRRWTFVLVILTFFLTIFGTFMTRSGIVQSVHAFGKDTRLAWIFTIFMTLVLLVSFGFFFARLSALRASRPLDSWLSREAATVTANWVFVLCPGADVRHHVPHLDRSHRTRTHQRGRALFQPLDGAHRNCAAGAHRALLRSGVASKRTSGSAPSPHRAGGRRNRNRRGLCGRWSGHVQRCPALPQSVGLHRHGHNPRNRPRRAKPQTQHGPRTANRAGRARVPRPPPLRRLSGPSRHDADVRGLRWPGLSARRIGGPEGRPDPRFRQVQHPF